MSRWLIDGNATHAFEYDLDGNLIFLGVAQAGTPKTANKWAIRRFTYDVNNNVTDIQFAGGSDDYKQVWNNRASLEYS